jgi:hypothetical protein
VTIVIHRFTWYDGDRKWLFSHIESNNFRVKLNTFPSLPGGYEGNSKARFSVQVMENGPFCFIPDESGRKRPRPDRNKLLIINWRVTMNWFLSLVMWLVVFDAVVIGLIMLSVNFIKPRFPQWWQRNVVLDEPQDIVSPLKPSYRVLLPRLYAGPKVTK